jgi:uncharacterized membrane protein YdjX (TVP38/TMEM64 family)
MNETGENTTAKDVVSPDSNSSEVVVTVDQTTPPKKPVWPRLLGLALVLITLLAIGHFTGASEYMTRENIAHFMQSLGVWGFLLFLLAFALGELVHVPGFVFIFAALIAYGRLWGALAGYAGALVAVTVAFYLVRIVGGRALTEIKQPLIKKALGPLEKHPIRTVAILRAVLWFAPAVNYALGLSAIRYRDYILGSAIGFIVPMVLFSALFDWAMSFFG